MREKNWGLKNGLYVTKEIEVVTSKNPKEIYKIKYNREPELKYNGVTLNWVSPDDGSIIGGLNFIQPQNTSYTWHRRKENKTGNVFSYVRIDLPFLGEDGEVKWLYGVKMNEYGEFFRWLDMDEHRFKFVEPRVTSEGIKKYKVIHCPEIMEGISNFYRLRFKKKLPKKLEISIEKLSFEGKIALYHLLDVRATIEEEYMSEYDFGALMVDINNGKFDKLVAENKSDRGYYKVRESYKEKTK